MSTSIRTNPLLGRLRVSALEQLMAAYNAAGHTLRDGIDGGAGAGALTKIMLEHCTGTVHGFEPFPGNHRFFSDTPRVSLHKAALASETTRGSLFVPSTVTSDSAWGKRGMEGYSSVGYLLDEYKTMTVERAPAEKVFEVECERADDVIDASCPVDVVKLDLQGGELNALLGMPRIMSQAKFLWVEYTAQPHLAGMLAEAGFLLFDTEYFFLGAPTAEIEAQFDITKPNETLSTGRQACFGFARHARGHDYEAWFDRTRSDLDMVQTDLVCVHRNALEEFMDALGYLSTPTQG